MTPINGIQPAVSPSAIAPAGKSASPSGSFGEFFSDAVRHVESHRQSAEDAAGRFLRGENEEIHQVILAGQRAEIAFETFLQVRNKVVQAYQEVMRMQI